MKFEEIFPAFKEGKKIRLSDWNNDYIDKNREVSLPISLLTRDDWEFYYDPIKSFQDVIDYLKLGQKLRRKCWHECYWVHLEGHKIIGNDDKYTEFEWDDVIATDWEIIQ